MTTESNYMVALLDDNGVLIGTKTCTKEEWVHTKNTFPVPYGCDLALKRYKLQEWSPGKFRFEPIIHPRDGAKENHQLIAPIVGPLARIVMSQARGVSPKSEDLDKVSAFLQTFDGAVS